MDRHMLLWKSQWEVPPQRRVASDATRATGRFRPQIGQRLRAAFAAFLANPQPDAIDRQKPDRVDPRAARPKSPAAKDRRQPIVP
ncbi:MAG: hypothetical protein AAFX81_13715 [Pseudomonadota bacterium]